MAARKYQIDVKQKTGIFKKTIFKKFQNNFKNIPKVSAGVHCQKIELKIISKNNNLEKQI